MPNNQSICSSAAKNQPTSFLKLLSRYYAIFASLFTNVLLTMVVVLALIQWVLDISSELRLKPFYSQAFALDSYILTDHAAAIQVGLEFDQMGEQESYEFYPWTVFMERSFAGKLLNIETHSNYTTRATKSALPLGENQKDLLVWTFGGSTMFGWGIPDNQTIPSHLQEQLQARLPKYRVRVINHGHNYWYSSQEIAHFIALLRSNEPPDVALFLDGINDTVQLSQGNDVPVLAQNAYAGWELIRQKRYYGDRSWITLNGAFPLLRLVNYLQTQPSPHSSDLTADEDVDKKILDVYRFNRKLAAAVSKNQGVDTYFFYNPHPCIRLPTKLCHILPRVS